MRLIRGAGRRLAAGVSAWVAIGLVAPAAFSMDDIVVTTRKTEESLVDVPGAVTAFGADTIEEARIENLDDVAALTPGLNFFNPIGDILPVPVIRGIAPTDIFGEPNAAIFVDGVYAAGREGLNFALLEVERIEIAKGPQSALYGRNAFSGAINYITKRPSDEFESTVEVTAGSENRAQGRAMISGPLVQDVLAYRASVAFDDWDGSYDNPIGDDDVGGYTYRTYQLGLQYTPNDRWDVLFNGYYSRDDVDDAAITGQIANCENIGGAGVDQRLGNLCGELWALDQVNAQLNANIPGNPNIPSSLQFFAGDDEIAKIPGSNGEEREVIRLSLDADWDLDYGSFVSLTGYSRVEQWSIVDGTRNLGFTYPFNYCTDSFPFTPTTTACNLAAPLERFTAGEFVFSPLDTTEEISQELRFDSPRDQRIRYILGLYYFNIEREDNEATLLARPIGLPFDGDDVFAPVVPPPGPPIAAGDGAFRPWFTERSTIDVDESAFLETESYAAFGKLDWDVNDQLTLDFQLRYTVEDREVRITAPLAAAGQQERSTDASFNFWTGRAGFKFAVSDDWNLYGSVSNGTKAGGFNAEVVEVLADPGDPNSEESRIVIVPFEEEELLSYELGIKGRTSDDRFRFDTAVYMQDWTDIVIPQVFTTDPLTGESLEQPEGFNRNAGDATVWGYEMQGELIFTDNLSYAFTLSYTDAIMDNGQLESFIDFPSFAATAGDVTGNTVLRQPEWMASGSLKYQRQAFGNWDFSARADITWQDEYFGGLDNQWTVPDHTYVNLRLGLSSDRWSISFWAKNLFNDDSPTAGFRDVYFGNSDDLFQQRPPNTSVFQFFPFRISVSHPRLRTWGGTIKVKFGAAQ